MKAEGANLPLSICAGKIIPLLDCAGAYTHKCVGNVLLTQHASCAWTGRIFSLPDGSAVSDRLRAALSFFANCFCYGKTGSVI